MSQEEIDRIYGLPFTRRPHPSYGRERIPAFEVVKDSIQIMRGCFGGCAFCSITLHEGRIIQSRSEASVLEEIRRMAEEPGFSGTISDLGGPTANMYQMGCTLPELRAKCRRLSCLWPTICPRLATDHGPLIQLLKAARRQPGVKRALVASGIRMDLALRSPAYVRQVARHHTGGLLKVAPEHCRPGGAAADAQAAHRAVRGLRPAIQAARAAAAGKRQFLVPYFIAGHPGCDLPAMIELALYLKRHGLKPDKVQEFIPGPMDIATCMYYTGLDPMSGEPVYVARGARERRLQRALLQYFKPENYADVRAALEEAGRLDLIGDGPECLIPTVRRHKAATGGRADDDRSAPGTRKARRRLPPAPENGQAKKVSDVTTDRYQLLDFGRAAGGWNGSADGARPALSGGGSGFNAGGRGAPGRRPTPASSGRECSAADGTSAPIQQKGQWTVRRPLPERWIVAHGPLRFELKRTDFGHVGLFPEQAENWEWIRRAHPLSWSGPGRVGSGQERGQRTVLSSPAPLRKERAMKILNLFAYTGGSTLAAAAAGAEVVHVDAAKNIVAWARRNAELSGLADAPVRWIAEDALKFVKRELRRGNRYDAVILDPPSYGHGPRGEVWRLAKHLPRLLSLCGELTAGRPQFMLLTCHTPGYDAAALREMLLEAVGGRPDAAARQLTLRSAAGRELPSGVAVRWQTRQRRAVSSARLRNRKR